MKKQTNLTGIEALMVAVNQEQDGIRFYRNAAELVRDQELKNAFLLLMKEEEKHRDTFMDFRSEIESKEEDFSLFDNPTALSNYISELVDYHVFGEEMEEELEKVDYAAPEQIIELGIRAEKMSVLFYLGVNMFSRNPDAQRIFDLVADEEMNHIMTLKNLLNEMKR